MSRMEKRSSYPTEIPMSCPQQFFDVIVVGGGIQGASLLLEASRRGLKGLLVERNDFGGATSWNSLRIIHGGLRYLQSADLKTLSSFCRRTGMVAWQTFPIWSKPLFLPDAALQPRTPSR